MKDGFYHYELISNALISTMNGKSNSVLDEIKTNELTFLQRIYKGIVAKMNISPKTIDGYSQNLFEKLNVKSREGLVLFAMQQKLIDMKS